MKYWQIKRVTLVGIIFFVYFLGMVTILLLFSRHGDTRDDARKAQVKSQIEYFKKSLFEFKKDNGFYPTTEQGLDSLVRKPTVGPIPKKYKVQGYLAKVPKNPWGNPFVYISPGSNGEFEIISSDGQRGSSQ